jgi:hypothetical protein
MNVSKTIPIHSYGIRASIEIFVEPDRIKFGLFLPYFDATRDGE